MRTKAQERQKQLRKLGISEGEYERQSIRQDHRCAICRKESVKRRLAVDHDHQTGAFRGLLCTRCNVALGLLGDEWERIKAAAEYLYNGGW